MVRICNHYLLLFFLAAAAGLASAGCTDECLRASDCLKSEVCYDGVCTPGTQTAFVCQSNADCNAAGDNSKCVAGLCVIDQSTIDPPCAIVPSCFERGGATPQALQTMTATTGVDARDRGAPMTDAVAIRQPGGNIINLIGQNSLTGRYMCVSINARTASCEIIQVAVGNPADPATNIYESTTCEAMLTATAGALTGDAFGDVADCNGDEFLADAVFDVTIQ